MKAQQAFPLMPRLIGGTVIVFVALLFGLVAASGFTILQMLIAGAAGGVLLLMLPLNQFLAVVLLVTFAVQGTAGYFLRFGQAQWIPYLLCMLAAGKLVLYKPEQQSTPALLRTNLWTSPPILFLGFYVAILLFATLLNAPRLSQVIVGLKNALPIWVIAFLVMRDAHDPKLINLVWRILYGVFYLQVPIVLYQHFVVVPGRADVTTAMDAVVGTFGGSMDAGGANATLVIFALFVMAFELARLIRGESSRWRLVFVWAAGLMIVFSGEVKAAFVWLPLCMLFVMRRRAFKSFLSMMMTVGTSLLLVLAMFMAYEAMYWSKGKQESATKRIESMEYFFDTSNINFNTGEISRGASIALWLKDPHADAVHRIFGYGVGASRLSGTGGLGAVAARYYPLSISATAVAVLLWDSGVVGTFCFIAVIFSAALMGWRLSTSGQLSAMDQARIEAWTIFLLIMGSMLIYNRSLTDEPSIQMLLALAVGFVLQYYARTRDATCVANGFGFQQSAPVLKNPRA